MLRTRVVSGFLACQVLLAYGAPGPDVTIKSLPRSTAIVRQMTGSYAQHSDAAHALLKLVSEKCATRGHVYGEYPEDPGAVGMENVHWNLGYEMAANDPCMSSLPKLYRVAVLPPTYAAVLTTTIAKTQEDGLAIAKWLPDSGYVQSAPTRIEYLDESGAPDSAVQIVMPVKKRTWP